MGVYRRSGDENHPWSPNGGSRPFLVSRVREANVGFSVFLLTAGQVLLFRRSQRVYLTVGRETTAESDITAA